MRSKALSSILGLCVLAGFGMNAFAAPSIRTANVKTTTATPIAAVRAGTLKTQPGKSVSASTPARSTSQVSAPSVESSDNTERMPMVKGIKNSNINALKDTTATNKLLNQLDSRIEELQSKLDSAGAVQNALEAQVTSSGLNEKQDKSTTLSFGDKEGQWTPVVTGDDYIELYTNSYNAREFRINPNMIATNLDNVQNANQLITAGAVQDALETQVTSSGLNEKQDKSTTLSLGAPDGGWTPVAIGSDYIELYTNTSNAKEIRIRPTMIATSLDNMDNEDQLITAGAVQEAIAAITANPGGGTQVSPYFNLINLQTRHGGLVQRYTYETNASQSEILDFALNVCDGNFSDRWCTLYESDGHTFKIVKRQEGHVLEDTTTTTNTQSGQGYGVLLDYSVNLPDGQTPQAYVNTQLCANRTGTCYMFSSFYLGSNGFDINDTLEPLYFIGVYQE